MQQRTNIIFSYLKVLYGGSIHGDARRGVALKHSTPSPAIVLAPSWHLRRRDINKSVKKQIFGLHFYDEPMLRPSFQSGASCYLWSSSRRPGSLI